jgi:hypothetical protein
MLAVGFSARGFLFRCRLLAHVYAVIKVLESPCIVLGVCIPVIG